MSKKTTAIHLSKKNESNLIRWRLILGKKSENYGFQSLSPHSGATSSRQRGNKRKSYGQKGNQSQTQDSANQTEQSEKSTRPKSSGKSIKPKDSENGANEIENRPRIRIEDIQSLDDTLNMVYKPDQQRGAGLGGSRLSVPKWLENVKKFFPTHTKEMMEKDLVKKSNIADIIDHPELFDKVEPNLEMVSTIIQLKHLLPEKVKSAARKLVKKVVDDLRNQLKSEVERHIIGAIKRNLHTPIKVFRNIDWKRSISQNLKHYNPDLKKLIMANPRFFSNEKRRKAWQIIVLIDESGSMADSVIYSVVMASIFASLPAVRTNLVIFDTQIVDLSRKIDDPVDILMSVQLGGGTDITKAVRYAQELIKRPKKTILVIISDFFEGRPITQLTNAIKHILEGGSKILGIASLGRNAKPYYNRRYARELNSLGIDVIACTPDNLPELIAKIMK